MADTVKLSKVLDELRSIADLDDTDRFVFTRGGQNFSVTYEELCSSIAAKIFATNDYYDKLIEGVDERIKRLEALLTLTN